MPITSTLRFYFNEYTEECCEHIVEQIKNKLPFTSTLGGFMAEFYRISGVIWCLDYVEITLEGIYYER